MRLLSGHDPDSKMRPENNLLDVMLTHDWPLNIHANGNVADLLRRKKFFKEDVDRGQLGNKLYQPLVSDLKPRFWFSAHLHVRFEAFVDFGHDIHTKFLALDKCLNRRPYLEVINIDPTQEDEKVLSYDPEWLAILRKTNEFVSIERNPIKKQPPQWIVPDGVSKAEVEQATQMMGDLKIPLNFTQCLPVLADRDVDPKRVNNYVNPQTTLFCQKLGITDPMDRIVNGIKPMDNPDKIDLEDDDEEEEEEPLECKKIRTEADEMLSSGVLFVVDTKGTHS